MNFNKSTEKSAGPFVVKLFLIAAFIVYLAFGTFHLTHFLTADEHLWVYQRINQYWDSLSRGNFKGTFINDKPGVSVALIAAPGYFLNRKNIAEAVKLNKKFNPLCPKIDPNIEKNLLSLRLPILIFNGFSIFFFFWIIKKITDNDWISLWSSMLIALSPILLGISQIINPDSLLWVFSTAAFLSFLAYLKTERNLFAFISSFSLGMALLSKYTAAIFFPFFLLISLIYLGYKAGERQNLNISVSEKIKKISAACLIIFAGSLLVFSLLMPAVFLKKELFFQGTIGYPGMQYFFWPLLGMQIIALLDAVFLKSRMFIAVSGRIGILLKKYSRIIYLVPAAVFLIVLICWMGEGKIIDLGKVIFDLGRDEKFAGLPLFKKIIFEVYPFVFSLTPVALFSLLYLWINFFLKKNHFNLLLFTVSLFFVVFYAAAIFQGLLTTIRYSIILYPLAAILAAQGIYNLLSYKPLAKVNKVLISSLLILISAWSLWLIKPYYFNYTSGLLPKQYLITDAWGYGGYEAAEYINSMPDSQNLVVWADYRGVCEFITQGRCLTSHEQVTNAEIDYFVLTRRGKIRYAQKGDKVKASGYYKRQDPVWTLYIGNRPGNYVKIFKNSEKNNE